MGDKGVVQRVLRKARGQLEDGLIKAVVAGALGLAGLWAAQFVPVLRPWLARETDLSVQGLLLALLFFTAGGAALALLAVRPRLRRLAEEAGTDELTGVGNSKKLQRRLAEEVERSARTKVAFSLILLDLDAFKEVNDRFGYAAGDQVLQEFAHLVAQELRLTDAVFRYKHGDEFAVVAIGAHGTGARSMAERLRGSVARYRFQVGDGLQMTFSAGVTTVGSDELDAVGIVQRAERGLAQAKVQKDRVELVEPEVVPAAVVPPWKPSAPR